MVKRRLTDLYVVGREFTFEDPEGEPIVVYIRKMSPVDQELAARKANAERSRILTLKKYPDSDEFAELLARAIDFGGKEELISYLNAHAIDSFRAAREAEFATEEEWSKDHYLDGLLEAWEGGLKEKYPDDPDAERVFLEMQRFSDRVDEEVEAEEHRLARQYEDVSLNDLRERVADELMNLTADSAWVREYRLCELWLGVRDNDNRRERYFESRDEIDLLERPVLTSLMEVMKSISVEPIEGKDLLRTDTSSVSSEQPVVEEISKPSGPSDVNE